MRIFTADEPEARFQISAPPKHFTGQEHGLIAAYYLGDDEFLGDTDETLDQAALDGWREQDDEENTPRYTKPARYGL